MHDVHRSGDCAPVESRWSRLDRRTFPPAIFVLSVSLLMIYGLRLFDAAIPWHNETSAGDVLDLGDGATAVPPVGWQLERGVLVGQGAADPGRLDVVLTSGGVTLSLRGTRFTGSADAFLDQVRRAEAGGGRALMAGPRSTFSTASGLTGVAETSTGPSGEGWDAAVKMARGSAEVVDAAPALLVRVRAAPGQLARVQGTVAAVLRSITPGAVR